MGYLKNKYTKEYFTSHDSHGRYLGFGVVGIEDFLMGKIRQQDKDILNKVDFRGKSVIDFGFGRGEAIKYAHENGAKDIIGVDFSPAAVQIASSFLKSQKIIAKLYCQDISKFIKNTAGKYSADIVLLLDVVEHIPRYELKKILLDLPKILHSKSLVVINTPIFKLDNDGYKEGIDPRTFEDSDESEITSGMHINRYTKESLIKFLGENGFTSLSGHYYILSQNIFSYPLNSLLKRFLSYLLGYPFLFPQLLICDKYELAYSRRSEGEPNLTVPKKIFRFIFWKLKALLRKLGLVKMEKNLSKPKIVTVIDGPLMGGKLYMSLNSAPHWPQMALGVYDKFIYNWIAKNLDINGAVVWDVGAHIGYHSLCFASLVGQYGQVIAFEPNIYNQRRINKNLKLNTNLTTRIKLVRYAISDRNGFSDFLQTDQIDDSRSSGSHLTDVIAPEPDDVYKGFNQVKVLTRRADTLVVSHKISPPDVIKIDVEGAEARVLIGADRILDKYKPTLFIEIHNVTAMFEVISCLNKHMYKIDLLDNASGSTSRCFLVAYPAKFRSKL